MLQTLISNCTFDISTMMCHRYPNFNFPLLAPINIVFSSKTGFSPVLPVSIDSTFSKPETYLSSLCLCLCMHVCICVYIICMYLSIISLPYFSYLINHQILPLLFPIYCLTPPPSPHPKNCCPNSRPHHLLCRVYFNCLLTGYPTLRWTFLKTIVHIVSLCSHGILCLLPT